MGSQGRLLVLAAIFITYASIIHKTEAVEGMVYAFAFLNISTDSVREGFQQIMISSDGPAEVRAFISGTGAEAYLTLDDTNNYSYQLIIPEIMGLPKSSQVAKIGLLVHANRSISVQANKAQAGSTDGFNVLPVTQEAKEFFVPSWPGVRNGHSVFGIISLKDGTCAEVFRVTDAGEYQRIHFFGLEELDVFQGLSDSEDFSGYFINSTKEIAVLAGNECAQIPMGTAFCDHIVTQVPPISAWGTEHISGGIDGRSRGAGYYTRIFAAEDDTQVTATIVSGNPNDFESPAGGIFTATGDGFTGRTFTGTVKKGRFVQLKTKDSMAVVFITCSKKCMPVQLNPSFKIVTSDIADTDPFMTLIPPITSYKNRYSFATAKFYNANSTQNFGAVDMNSYVTVIAQSTITNGIRFDGQATTSSWEALSGIAAGSYSTTTFPISAGFHRIDHPDPTAKFTVTVYGHGKERINTAYGFTAGMHVSGADPTGDYYDIAAMKAKSLGTGGGGGGGGGGGDVTPDPADVTTAAADDSWIALVTDEELLATAYALSMRANFTTTKRRGKLTERKCVDPFLDLLNDVRMPAMQKKMNEGVIGSLCNNMNIKATLSNGYVRSEYSRGAIHAQIELSGTGTSVTFKHLEECGKNIKEYVKQMDNWPKASNTKFLYVNNEKLRADCDEVDIEDNQWSITGSSFQCDGFEGAPAGSGADSVWSIKLSSLFILICFQLL